MAQTIKRTNSGDAANIFVRCILSDISDILGGFSDEDLERTVKYFDYKCPYTGEDISVEYKTKKWVLDHLIPHNRESAGLNLYGNIIVTTKGTNSAKAAKNYEDFIRNNTDGSDEEKEARIKKIRKFQSESGYFGKVKNIEEIKELCKREYDSIQNRLKELKREYKKILSNDKHILVHSISTIDEEKPKKNIINQNYIRKVSLSNSIIRDFPSFLDDFEEYLVKTGKKRFTPQGALSTAPQYKIAVKEIIRREKMLLKDFCANINSIIVDYDTGGEKEKLGEKGHRTWINALKRFKEYLIKINYVKG